MTNTKLNLGKFVTIKAGTFLMGSPTDEPRTLGTPASRARGKIVKGETLKTARNRFQNFTLDIPDQLRSKSVGIFYRELK